MLDKLRSPSEETIVHEYKWELDDRHVKGLEDIAGQGMMIRVSGVPQDLGGLWRNGELAS